MHSNKRTTMQETPTSRILFTFFLFRYLLWSTEFCFCSFYRTVEYGQWFDSVEIECVHNVSFPVFKFCVSIECLSHSFLFSPDFLCPHPNICLDRTDIWPPRCTKLPKIRLLFTNRQRKKNRTKIATKATTTTPNSNCTVNARRWSQKSTEMKIKISLVENWTVQFKSRAASMYQESLNKRRQGHFDHSWGK